ncbi:hypothetical protein BJ912DRAFT_928233 [Pholiota molesta]|nr:hypothetical protein BJ912DRAFT_928233 [Pholiota molesta]
MSQIPDTQSSTKKRRIEDVLGEKSDLTDPLDTSMASESVVVDATQFKDEHVATTSGTKDTGNLPEVEVHAEDDHLAKKCRLDAPQIADPSAESSLSPTVRSEAKAVEVDAMAEQARNMQGTTETSKGKALEGCEGSTRGSQIIAEDVRTGQKRRLEDTQLESDANTEPPTLPTSPTNLNPTTAIAQEANSAAVGPPAKKQRTESIESTSATASDSASKLAEAEEPPAEQTESSQHVLAVARTCKALCHLLLGPEAQFIWRAARNGPGCIFEVEIPPPPPPVGMPGGGAGAAWGVVQGGLVPAAVVGAVPNANDPPAPTKKIVKLPNLPAQFFSEAAYAAFVFDSGECESCGKETSVMYNSFGLRARLCKKVGIAHVSFQVASSTRSLLDNLQEAKGSVTSGYSDIILCDITQAVDRHILTTLPTNEMGSFATQALSVQTLWPTPMRYYLRKDAFVAAKAEYVARHNDAEYQNKFKLLQARRKEWMDFCAELYKWKCARQEQYYRTKKNQRGSVRISPAVAVTIVSSRGKQLASKHGWDYDQIINHTKYGVYKRRKTQLIETVTETDVNVMKDGIEAELLAYSAKADNRKTEISLMHNRKDIAGLYERLRSGTVHTYLPSLATFRQLPVISMLQTAERDKKSPSAVETLEKNPVMNDLLNNQLKKWTDKAKMDFGVILGFPKNWKHASKNILHPVERVTARFVCTRCQRVDNFAKTIRPSTHEENSSFAELCRRQRWRQLLTKIGMAVKCTSCDPPIILDTRTIVGHSHRHDNIQLTLPMLDDVCSYLGGYPYEHGVVAKFLGPTGISPDAKAEIEAKNFGYTGVTMVAEASNPIELASVVHRLHDTGIQGPLTKPPTPLFSFNGMRSHLKAKHHIEDIRDEDILCYRR